MPHCTSLNKKARYAQWLDVYAERLLPGGYTALMIAHTPEGFEFDAEEAAKLKDKPLVVFDMREYGWEKSHANMDLLGIKREDQVEYSGDEWLKLHSWAQENPARLYFKRELSVSLKKYSWSSKCIGVNLHPVDLISRNRPLFEPQTKDEWMKHKPGVHFVYGNSHPDRMLLHGELIGRNFPAYCENVHHTNRRPLMQIILEQMEYMLSVSLSGAGFKCFRSSESCVGCIPVMADLPVVYSVPFTKENVVLLPTENGRIKIPECVDVIEQALSDPEALYPVYLAAQESARLLEQDTYMREIINPKIKEVL